jgi:hypothetical protein
MGKRKSMSKSPKYALLTKFLIAILCVAMLIAIGVRIYHYIKHHF